MNITIVGLGSIGGFFAARLAQSGHTVSALARGATLDAVRAKGLTLHDAGASVTVPILASDDAAELGPQDLVIITVKSQSLPSVVASLAPLLGDGTILLPAMNGVPWWLLPSKMPGESPLPSIDPNGDLATLLPVDRVLGCVVHLSSRVIEPGVVHHNSGDHLVIGEARGGESSRADAVSDVFRGAGFQVDTSADVARSVWYKLWGNMTMNPLSMITGGTTAELLDDPLIRSFVARVMTEAAAIGARIGCAIEESPEDRMKVTRKLGGQRTSMLEDALHGRPIELDAILVAVKEIGERVGVATPNIDALLGIARLTAQLRGLYPG